MHPIAIAVMALSAVAAVACLAGSLYLARNTPEARDRRAIRRVLSRPAPNERRH